MDNKINKKNVIIIIVSVICGFLLLAQFRAIVKSLPLTQQDNLMQLSYQIIEDSNNIFNLKDEYDKLITQNDSFSFDIKDKTKMRDDMQAKISQYQDINGLNGVSGRGVEIKVEGTMLTEEIVDLINGIRNTKPQAIAIDNKRIIYRTYFIVNTDGKIEFDNNKFPFPITIDVLGDPDELTTSLNRPGGILDVLTQNSFGKLSFSIDKKDNLQLPAYDGKTDFHYAKISS